ncbi:unnamed protein product [Dovyalis caffra]|uniref:Uncharacterized protein n=1 Tax=Dovyalis caffra TaxID=77055 RepID=A0AAV1S150_9ROSI|nr:unnamed protein product [Dovyalis caffra]
MDQKEDERREEAIASNPSLQANFKPKRVTQDQLSKLQNALMLQSFEILCLLDGTGKSHGKALKSKDTGTNIEDSGVSHLKTSDDNVNFSAPQDNDAHHSEKKRQKLHWGYALLFVIDLPDMHIKLYVLAKLWKHDSESLASFRKWSVKQHSGVQMLLKAVTSGAISIAECYQDTVYVSVAVADELNALT